MAEGGLAHDDDDDDDARIAWVNAFRCATLLCLHILLSALTQTMDLPGPSWTFPDLVDHVGYYAATNL